MTREEIIEGLKLLKDNMVYFDKLLNDKGEYIDVHELLFESIEVLEQEPCEGCDYKEWLKREVEPFINKPCVSSGVCEHDKQKVLDKIRAEIEQEPYVSKMEVLDIIDKYKAESEDKE